MLEKTPKEKPKRDKMYVNWSVPRPKFVEFEVDPEFAEKIIGFKVATRRFCSTTLWTYILKNNLFVSTIGNGKKVFVPDDYLSTILGKDQIQVTKGLNLFLNAKLKKIQKK